MASTVSNSDAAAPPGGDPHARGEGYQFHIEPSRNRATGRYARS
jgi:hypothetical protein